MLTEWLSNNTTGEKSAAVEGKKAHQLAFLPSTAALLVIKLNIGTNTGI